jgi:hypothetical protein
VVGDCDFYLGLLLLDLFPVAFLSGQQVTTFSRPASRSNSSSNSACRFTISLRRSKQPRKPVGGGRFSEVGRRGEGVAVSDRWLRLEERMVRVC